MHWWNDGWHMGWMIYGWIAFLVVCVLLIRYFVAAAGRTRGSHETPAETLRRRYAAGEIDRDAYLRMSDDLKK